MRHRRDRVRPLLQTNGIAGVQPLVDNPRLDYPAGTVSSSGGGHLTPDAGMGAAKVSRAESTASRGTTNAASLRPEGRVTVTSFRGRRFPAQEKRGSCRNMRADSTFPKVTMYSEMPELSIIVPTFNESGNVDELLRRLDRVLAGIRWEITFVDDDSPDGTADLVRKAAQQRQGVRCLQRIGRRGLSRAVVEGILSTASPFVAVMDADLQHDEALLPDMLAAVKADGVDLVVGSRYMEGGSVGEWDSRRAMMSQFATWLARRVVRTELTDPMSGFFLIKRRAFDQAVRNLSGEGYKILLDIIASSPNGVRLVELPYTFRARIAGESKLDSAVLWEYLMLVIDKTIGK